MCFHLDLAYKKTGELFRLDHLVGFINLNFSFISKNNLTTETIDIAAYLYLKIVTNVSHKCFQYMCQYCFHLNGVHTVRNH